LEPSVGALLSKGFTIEGCLDTRAWFIEQPLTGWIEVGASPVPIPVPISSIDLELCQMEGCTSSEGHVVSKTSTVQFTQIAEGNVSLGLKIPIYVVIPRLYSCPSLQARTTSISFFYQDPGGFCN